MKRLVKKFTKTNMSWKLVILISVGCGVITGMLMVPDFLKETSFQQPGRSFEFWIFMAMFIVLNCKKPLEAGLKTFVFFLISQPLIYLVQVPFSWMHWRILSYYPEWGIITLLTLPGGMIAWYTKKGNFLSILILSVANLILCSELPYMVNRMFVWFPHMLLTTLFIIGELLLFIFLIFKERKKRIITSAITLIMILFFMVYAFKFQDITTSSIGMPAKGTGPYTLLTESEVFDVAFDDNGKMTILYKPYKIKEDGSYTIQYQDSKGNKFQVHLTYGNGYCSVDP
ncbi:hypothetical protein N3C_1592 [Clostridium sp. N3C]|nr:hypothetical protein N3C_1592 [Clostridium sp. N3C]